MIWNNKGLKPAATVSTFHCARLLVGGNRINMGKSVYLLRKGVQLLCKTILYTLILCSAPSKIKSLPCFAPYAQDPTGIGTLQLDYLDPNMGLELKSNTKFVGTTWMPGGGR